MPTAPAFNARRRIRKFSGFGCYCTARYSYLQIRSSAAPSARVQRTHDASWIFVCGCGRLHSTPESKLGSSGVCHREASYKPTVVVAYKGSFYNGRLSGASILLHRQGCSSADFSLNISGPQISLCYITLIPVVGLATLSTWFLYALLSCIYCSSSSESRSRHHP
jgi:hypothetical protein